MLRGRRLARVARRVYAAAVLLAALGCASASAATFCVNAPGCVIAGGTVKSDLQTALNAATLGTNVVDVGPGTYVGSFQGAPNAFGFDYQAGAGSSVAIVGAGVGQTILMPVPGTATNDITLALTGGGSSVSNLTVMRGSATSQALGIQLNSAGANHVAIADVTPASPSNGSGIDVAGGTAAISDCSIAVGSSATGTPVFASGGSAAVTIDRCTLRGYYGAYTNAGATLKVLHSTLTALGNAAVYGYGTMTVQDDLLLLNGPNRTGIEALAGNTPSTSASVAAKGVTIVGGAADVGVDADALGGGSGMTADVVLDSSIVRGPAVSLKTVQGGAPATASIHVGYSDYASLATSGSGIVAGPGVINNADPGFVNPAAGDYHIFKSSPLIDQGNPAALLAGDSTLDLDGGARVVNGRIDMGAYEYGRRTPIATATATPTGATPGQLVTFDGSGSHDPDPGDALTFAWSFDDGATASGPMVTHAFATTGVHVATLIVTDPTALTATFQVAVRIAVPPTPPPPPPPPPHTFAGVSFTQTRLTLSTAGKVGVTLRCPAKTTRDCSGTLTLTATLPAKKAHKTRAKTHAKAKAKATKIASAIFRVRPGQTKTTTLTLSKAAAALVRAKHKLTTSASAVAHDGAHTSHTTKRTLTIAPAPRTHHHHH